MRKFKQKLYNNHVNEWISNREMRSPASWLAHAMELKVAANRIHWLDEPPRRHEPALHLLFVYRMLVGMSFEALLKGLLVAQGILLDEQGRIQQRFATHQLHDLAKELNKKTKLIDDEGCGLFEEISPYVA